MNKSGLVLATAALLCAAPCGASECLLPGMAAPASNLSTVAPEMQRAVPADPYCVSAPEALALIRVRAATPAAGVYVPLTKHDNTPWRFEMSQNGKQMTAVEFEAWMKAKGIRVATGRPAVPATATSNDADPAAPAETGQ